MSTSGTASHDLPDDGVTPPGDRTSGSPPAASTRPEAMKAIPVRHWGRWIAAVLIILLMAAAAYSIAKNPRVGWSTIGDFLFDGYILGGVVVTLYLTVIAMAIGVVGGTLIAVMRLSKNPILSSVAQAYIWFFRGTPVFVQILFWGFIAVLCRSLPRDTLHRHRVRSANSGILVNNRSSPPSSPWG